jgi:hypothetical protein
MNDQTPQKYCKAHESDSSNRCPSQEEFEEEGSPRKNTGFFLGYPGADFNTADLWSSKAVPNDMPAVVTTLAVIDSSISAEPTEVTVVGDGANLVIVGQALTIASPGPFGPLVVHKGCNGGETFGSQENVQSEGECQALCNKWRDGTSGCNVGSNCNCCQYIAPHKKCYLQSKGVIGNRSPEHYAFVLPATT